MNYQDLGFLSELNNEEVELEKIQAQIDLARKKYFDVGEIQLKLDRRQAELDVKKKANMNAKGFVLNQN